jgi:hypothetical protein
MVFTNKSAEHLVKTKTILFACGLKLFLFLWFCVLCIKRKCLSKVCQEASYLRISHKKELLFICLVHPVVPPPPLPRSTPLHPKTGKLKLFLSYHHNHPKLYVC